MSNYTEYYTVVYRNDQRVVILNQDAKPTKKPVLKKKSKYYEPIQITNSRFRPRIVNGGDNPSQRWDFPLF